MRSLPSASAPAPTRPTPRRRRPGGVGGRPVPSLRGSWRRTSERPTTTGTRWIKVKVRQEGSFRVGGVGPTLGTLVGILGEGLDAVGGRPGANKRRGRPDRNRMTSRGGRSHSTRSVLEGRYMDALTSIVMHNDHRGRRMTDRGTGSRRKPLIISLKLSSTRLRINTYGAASGAQSGEGDASGE